MEQRALNPNHPFFRTICELRQREVITLFSKLPLITEEEEAEVVAFLLQEYREESLEYPHDAPEYNGAAALWAARTLYRASQLLLYRENREDELPVLLPVFPDGPASPGAILSADLCLRFLPQVLKSAAAFDPEDALLSILQQHLEVWHYSAIGAGVPLIDPDLHLVLSDPCLQQLYTDRVIGRKAASLAQHPGIQPQVKASLGLHAALFWDEIRLPA